MSAYIYLILFSYVVIKHMYNSLATKELGIEQLPYVYIAIAITALALTPLYTRLTSTTRLNRLIIGIAIFLMCNLLLFWWLLRLTRSPVLFYVLRIWTSLYGVLTVSQSWTLAKYVFDAREGRRVIPVLGLAAGVGAWSGSKLTERFAELVGTESLAVFCIVCLGGSIILLTRVWKQRSKKGRPTEAVYHQSHPPIGDLLRMTLDRIRSSRHLALLVGITTSMMAVSQITEFQFLVYGDEIRESTDGLTAFLGQWESRISIVAIVMQLLLMGPLRRFFGAGAVLPLPILIGGASIWVIVGATGAAVTAAKIVDGSLRYSVNRSGLELLYLPLPERVMKTTKAFIDVVADRLARGLAGVLVLVFYSWLGISMERLSFVSAAIAGGWLFCVITVRRAYVNAYRNSLRRRNLDLGQVNFEITEKEIIEDISAALDGTTRQVIYALRVLESAGPIPRSINLEKLLRHPSPEVREGALRLLSRGDGSSAVLDHATAFLTGADDGVRAESAQYISLHSNRARRDVMAELCSSPDQRVRSAAVEAISRHGVRAIDMEPIVKRLIEDAHDDDSEARRQAAQALGLLRPTSPLLPRLDRLINDESIDVAIAATVSAGNVGRRSLVPMLIAKFLDRRTRPAAREALAKFGDGIIGTLEDHLNDRHERTVLRANVLRVLLMTGTQKAADVLLNSIVDGDASFRFRTIRTLSKLRHRHPELRFDGNKIKAEVRAEAEAYYRDRVAWADLDDPPGAGPGYALLRRVLEERASTSLEAMFRLLGLRYRQNDLYLAHTRLAGDRTTRARAIMLIESVVERDVRHLIMPIVDARSLEEIVARARSRYHIAEDTPVGHLAALLRANDNWLRTCSIFAVGELDERSLADDVGTSRHHTNRLVRDTAERVYGKLTR
jgi:ATP/ADP translocase